MNAESLKQLLASVADGSVAPDQAMERLRSLPFEDLGFAHVDHHRSLRKGYPETIFCQGKTTEQTLAIAERIAASGSLMLATRIDEDTARALCERLPGAVHDPVARTVVLRPEGDPGEETGMVAVVSAGTSDVPVAQEAVVTARSMGARVEAIYDVGVAGIHRLLAYADRLRKARVIVVVAGMEGALASVVGGLVDSPVIAVPTSVGYGASFNGLAALLTMLNSCASGVLVVNIDNGYGAGYAAALINHGAKSSEG
ncbi:nickel pincer cofactor biosynthesis protein LarB [Candidatus Latescibacterota bacterium]